MAKENHIKGITTVLETLKDDNFLILASTEAPAQPWNNLTSKEVTELVDETLELLKELLKTNLIEKIPANHLNSINIHLTKFAQQFQSVKVLQPSQLKAQHHGPLNQINAVDTNIRATGIYSLLKLSPDIDQKNELIESQLEYANKAKSELSKLTDQTKELLGTTVAGAISNAFEVRKKQVSHQKWFWFVMIAFSTFGSIWLTFEITEFLTSVFIDSKNTADNIGFVWFLRLFLLVPAYFFVLFALSQYLRERHFEENYAHKSALALTLPSYKELVVNPDVQDKITSSATKIVFTLPFAEQKGKVPKKGLITSELKEIVDIIKGIKGGSE